MRQHTSKMIESLLSKRNVERTVIEGTSGHESTRCTGHVVQVEICVFLDVYGWTCIFRDGGPRNRRRWQPWIPSTAGGQSSSKTQAVVTPLPSVKHPGKTAYSEVRFGLARITVNN